MEGRAFLSVSDKTGIVEFAEGLVGLNYEIISTGGTKKALEDAGVPVTGVSEITGFAECLDGRVKTLHPNIHGGILAMRSNEDHMKQIAELGIKPIDIVAVNLYPFKQTISKENFTFEEAVENIDIGGPSMLRAAAKNYQDVLVLVDSADYPKVLQLMKGGGIGKKTRLQFAGKVFQATAAYDALIANYLNGVNEVQMPEQLTLTYEKVQDMRYGENPHQKAAFYSEPLIVPGSLSAAEQLNGKELSYNNINDTDAALRTLRDFSDGIAVVGLKHANPCAVAQGATVKEAWEKAYAADSTSIFGGIVAINDVVEADAAALMAEIFLEIIVAPEYTDEALEILRKKKNLRVLRLPTIKDAPEKAMEVKSVQGGLLVQDVDTALVEGELTVATDRAPTEKELTDLLFAWKVCKHLKSNAIAIAKDGATLGLGPGQVNRIWPTISAIERSGQAVKGAVMASDAYFPFNDCVAEAVKAGITAIIQPGGSIRDQDSIDLCNEHGIAMVFTGMRHFKH